MFRDFRSQTNNRPQGSTDYVISLRKALDAEGFKDVGITMEATWQELINNVLTNPAFNASVYAATKHYPCNDTSAPAIQVSAVFGLYFILYLKEEHD